MKYEREPEIQPAPRPSTEDAYMAWAMQGYIHDFGLSAEDAFDLARIDWQIHLEAQSCRLPKVKSPGEMDMHAQLVRASWHGKASQATLRALGAKPKAPPKAKPAPKPKVHDFRGVEFDSFPEMCRRWGKNPSTVEGRLGRGWSLERALTEPARPIGHL